MKAKIKENGYFHLEAANKWLLFSMTAWILLKKETGEDLVSFTAKFDSKDMLEQYEALCQVAFAALKANDLLEGNEIDYDIYKVQYWMEDMDADIANEFVAAMTHSLNSGEKGKKKSEKQS